MHLNDQTIPKSTHPGIYLRENVLPALKCAKTEIAQMLGISRQTLYDILGGRQSVTPAMALCIGKLTGTAAEMWLNMQQAYDLKMSRKLLADRLEKIPVLEEAW